MILVTGATGLSGSLIVEELSRQGVPVRALFRNPDRAGQLRSLPGVEPVQGDMLRPETLVEAFEGVERVLLISSAKERMGATQAAFIDAAKAAGVPHIVKLSGKEAGVGFDLQGFQGTREHLEIEQYLEKSGVAWTHLRPSQFMQLYLPGGNYGIDPVRHELRIPNPRTRLSPIDIEDIAKIAVAVMTSEGHEGKIYEMTGPEALSMQDVVERMTEATGVRHTYVEVSREDRLREYRERGLPAAGVQIMDELIAERGRHTESHLWLDAHRTFGVTPTSFADFARRNAKALLGQ
ncbi:SDR family oxidoreductase [Actinomadura montaniterrae]|uniref:SDR family oxidoreductase n=1 Tax=Actinomadura montaniterrae TaxID=1803903 RepID=A0A6L3W5L6_9ACTN|nr:SDR family oxidoreductase [Actinomadura montaniterrae]KAB2384870.1 SDR family oxidoreductase [Actinomadura montaniterrae]